MQDHPRFRSRYSSFTAVQSSSLFERYLKRDLDEHFNFDEKFFLRSSLVAWYNVNRRKLPWRGDVVDGVIPPVVSPYGIWISESMCQQTRIETVVPYWHRWMNTFPSVAVLANSTPEEVNKMWAGLGYYRRAQQLLKGAHKVVQDYGSIIPDSVEELLKIPGIGPYTAGAISSIAFGCREPLVDGNVIRVISRLRAVRHDLCSKEMQKTTWALAGSIVRATDDGVGPTASAQHRVVVAEDAKKKQKKKTDEGQQQQQQHSEGGGVGMQTVEAAAEKADQGQGQGVHPGTLNQALMELGATVCKPTSPKCEECPLSSICHARAIASYSSSLGPALPQEVRRILSSVQPPAPASSLVSTTATSTGEVVDSVGGKEALSAKARSGKRAKNGSQSLDRSKVATTTAAAAAASDGVHDLTDCQTVSDTGDGLVDIEDLVPLEVTFFPRKTPKKKPREVVLSVCVLRLPAAGAGAGAPTADEEGDRFLFVRRPSTGLLANQWEFPCVEMLPQPQQEQHIESAELHNPLDDDEDELSHPKKKKAAKKEKSENKQRKPSKKPSLVTDEDGATMPDSDAVVGAVVGAVKAANSSAVIDSSAQPPSPQALWKDFPLLLKQWMGYEWLEGGGDSEFECAAQLQSSTLLHAAPASQKADLTAASSSKRPRKGSAVPSSCISTEAAADAVLMPSLPSSSSSSLSSLSSTRIVAVLKPVKGVAITNSCTEIAEAKEVDMVGRGPASKSNAQATATATAKAAAKTGKRPRVESSAAAEAKLDTDTKQWQPLQHQAVAEKVLSLPLSQSQSLSLCRTFPAVTHIFSHQRHTMHITLRDVTIEHISHTISANATTDDASHPLAPPGAHGHGLSHSSHILSSNSLTSRAGGDGASFAGMRSSKSRSASGAASATSAAAAIADADANAVVGVVESGWHGEREGGHGRREHRWMTAAEIRAAGITSGCGKILALVTAANNAPADVPNAVNGSKAGKAGKNIKNSPAAPVGVANKATSRGSRAKEATATTENTIKGSKGTKGVKAVAAQAEISPLEEPAEPMQVQGSRSSSRRKKLKESSSRRS